MEDNFDEYDMNIELTDYCVVVLGKVEGVKDEISKVSQTPPKYMDAKGLVISVFKSAMNVNELNVYFKINTRSFLLFELGDGNFGVHLNEKFNNFLFGGLINDIVEKDDEIGNDVLSTLLNNTRKESAMVSGETENEITILEESTEYFSKLTNEQQKMEIDTIIAKISESGVKALSELELGKLKKFS
tara:strand:+ start:1283 stop:1843 length:561 start_codon:yes stop_codon:yes gene_type:complete